MSYQLKFMDDAIKTEVDELLQGEHGSAIAAFGWECGNAAVCGYKQACVKSTLLTGAGALLIFGAVNVGKKIVDKCKKKKLNKTKKYVEVDL